MNSEIDKFIFKFITIELSIQYLYIYFLIILNRTDWATAERLRAPTTTLRTTMAKVTTTVETTVTTSKSRKHKRKDGKRKHSGTDSMEMENVCEDREDGVYVRDPTDCASFFTCYLGGSSIKTTCGAGLMFDETCSCCNWPQNVRLFEKSDH